MFQDTAMKCSPADNYGKSISATRKKKKIIHQKLTVSVSHGAITIQVCFACLREAWRHGGIQGATCVDVHAASMTKPIMRGQNICTTPVVDAIAQ